MFTVREISSQFFWNISCDCKIFYPTEMSTNPSILLEVVHSKDDEV